VEKVIYELAIGSMSFSLCNITWNRNSGAPQLLPESIEFVLREPRRCAVLLRWTASLPVIPADP